MSQSSEMPASAYTPEMEIFGALPNIPTFDDEPVPVSRNPLTAGMRPLQLLPLSGSEFPVRYETSQMRGFRSEVNLGKAVQVDRLLMLLPSGICWTHICEHGLSLQVSGIMPLDCAAHSLVSHPLCDMH
ncbi:hypothetical protein JCGZ_08912 [Jatropha curcas]|uniref:Uncharacterized protein n=1 Tax=Jatropha curcas TaxID=180498 RepID=A0A067LQQ4_JATCU|nr:hypothetical protein JCGZ_08912 [Jatropha curcas]